MGVKFQKVYAVYGEVDKKNFSNFRTANLNISFNHVEWIFYYFEGVNFQNSEDLMIMVMLNWINPFNPFVSDVH